MVGSFSALGKKLLTTRSELNIKHIQKSLLKLQVKCILKFLTLAGEARPPCTLVVLRHAAPLGRNASPRCHSPGRRVPRVTMIRYPRLSDLVWTMRLR